MVELIAAEPAVENAAVERTTGVGNQRGLAARVGNAGAVAPGAAIVAAVFGLQPVGPELVCAGEDSNVRLIE